MKVINGSDSISMLVHKDHSDPSSFPRAGGNFLLVRAWNKSRTEVQKFVSRMKELKKSFPYLALLFVLDGEREEGDTRQWLELDGSDLPLVMLTVYGQTVNNWTRLLNAGIKYLRLKGVQDGKLFVCSFETEFAEFTRDSIGKARLHICTSRHPIPCTTFRSTPSSLLPGLTEMIQLAGSRQEMCWKALENAILYARGEVDILSPVCKALPTICRNTAMVWDFRSLWAVGGFDPRCNEWGGQEELAHILRLALLRRDDGVISLIEGGAHFQYSDPRLSVIRNEGDQQKKIQTEMSSIERILSEYRNRNIEFVPDFDLA